MLGRFLIRGWTVDDDGVERELQQWRIVGAGGAYPDPKWPSFRFDEETFLDARLRLILWIYPDALVETMPWRV